MGGLGGVIVRQVVRTLAGKAVRKSLKGTNSRDGKKGRRKKDHAKQDG